MTDTMFIRQVAIWLRFPNAASFSLAYCHDSISSSTSQSASLQLNRSCTSVHAGVYHIQSSNVCNGATTCSLESTDPALELDITRIVSVIQGDRVQGFLGIRGNLSIIGRL